MQLDCPARLKVRRVRCSLHSRDTSDTERQTRSSSTYYRDHCLPTSYVCLSNFNLFRMNPRNTNVCAIPSLLNSRYAQISTDGIGVIDRSFALQNFMRSSAKHRYEHQKCVRSSAALPLLELVEGRSLPSLTIFVNSYQIVEGSFLAVSKPIFATEY